MTGFAKFLLVSLLAWTAVDAGAQNVVQSTRAAADVAPLTDPASTFWRDAQVVRADKDAHGKPAGRFMEVRSRWTDKYLYFLFACPYDELYVKPSPDTKQETNELWKWDVAEVFIGSNFKDIKRYKEFEVSPQGEWVDLDINLHNPHHEDGWLWNSGFEHDVRVDSEKHIWYATMKIPMRAVDSAEPVPGTAFRVNFFLSQGPANHHRELVWQPTMSNTFHVPERFGTLKLVR